MKEGEKSYHIVSPLSGTFYGRPTPEEPPYVKEGDKIERGQVVCIVESMKIFNEVRTDRAGMIHKILVNDEDPVLINQPLIEVTIV